MGENTISIEEIAGRTVRIEKMSEKPLNLKEWTENLLTFKNWLVKPLKKKYQIKPLNLNVCRNNKIKKMGENC